MFVCLLVSGQVRFEERWVGCSHILIDCMVFEKTTYCSSW